MNTVTHSSETLSSSALAAPVNIEASREDFPLHDIVPGRKVNFTLVETSNSSDMGRTFTFSAVEGGDHPSWQMTSPVGTPIDAAASGFDLTNLEQESLHLGQPFFGNAKYSVSSISVIDEHPETLTATTIHGGRATTRGTVAALLG